MIHARMPRHYLLLCVIILIASQMACNIPGTEQQAAPTGNAQPLPTSITSPPRASLEAELTEMPGLSAPEPLDLCALLTTAEVEAALGGSLAAPPAPQSGSCTYTATPDGGTPLTLSVSAGYGEEGKEILGAGAMTLLMFGGVPDAQQQYETLVEGASSMTLSEFLAAVLPMYAAIGYVQTDIPDVEDAAYWLWNEQFTIGTLFLVRGETFVSVGLIGLEEAAAQEQALPLAQTALDRLPPAFDVLPDDTISVDVTIEPGPANPTADMPPAVWVTDAAAGTVLRIDPDTKEVLARIPVGTHPVDVAAGGGSVWAISDPENNLVRIDPAANGVIDTFTLPGKVRRVAYGYESVWVVGESGAHRIDLATAVVITLTNQPADGVAISDQAVWITQAAQNRVMHIDPATNQVMMTIGVDGAPTEIDEGRGAIWVLQSDLHTVARIDPATYAVTLSVIPENVSIKDLDAGTAGLWTPGILFETDTFSSVASFRAGSQVEGMAAGLGGVWIACGAEGVVRFVNGQNYEIAAEVQTGGQVERVAISGE